jgi:hypothetical protein
VLLRRSTGSPADVRSCAHLLLDAGADPNSRTIEWGGEGQTSALYAGTVAALLATGAPTSSELPTRDGA